MRLKKNLPLTFPFYAAGMPVVFLAGMFGTVYTGDLNFLMFCFLIIYVITVFQVIKYFGILSLYAIYLYTSTFFIYDCFWFTLFGDKNFLLATYPHTFLFPKELGKIFLICCCSFVYFVHLAYCLWASQLREIDIRKEKQCQYKKCGKHIMLLFLFPCITRLYIQLKYIMQYGYLAVFSGGLYTIKYPFWTMGAISFFLIGYAVFLSGNPDKREFLLFSILFLAISALDSMKGQRGVILGRLVFVVYWYYKKYGQKISVIKMIALFCIVIAITILIGNHRAGKKMGKNLDVMSAAVSVLYGQSASRYVTMLVIQGNLKYHPYPFVFSPIIRNILQVVYPNNGQSVVSAEKYNDISQVTMYNVSTKAHLEGKGYGGSTIAEAYDCGGIAGIIFWGAVLALFMLICDKTKLNFKAFHIPIVFFILKDFGMLPRGRLLGFMLSFPMICMTYFIMLVINARRYSKREFLK